MFIFTSLFYIVVLIQPFGYKNPINDKDEDDEAIIMAD